MTYKLIKQINSDRYLLTHDQTVTVQRIDRDWESFTKWQATTIDGPYLIKQWAPTKDQAVKQVIDYLNRFN